MIDKRDIELSLKNDRAAQKRLYDALAPKMYAVCLRYASKRVSAEDILQDAFIKMFKYLASYNYEGPFEAWVRRIVVNTAYDHIKKFAEPFDDIEENSNEEYLITVNEGLNNLSSEELFKIIQELPEGKRLIFNLYVFEGYSHKEIADMLSISVMTSKAQLSKAKKMLQEKLTILNKFVYEHK